MARNNKYTSLNFNEIYEKKTSSTTTSNNKLHASPSSSSAHKSSHLNPNKTILSNSRIHGHMLVLSRPTPKPIAVPTQPPPSQPQQNPSPPPVSPDQNLHEPNSISLRPLGRTGSGPSFSSSPLPSSSSPLSSPKPDKQFSGQSLPRKDRFVPPHLRPGFVGREAKPGPDFQRQTGVRTKEEFGGGGHHQGHYVSSPNRYGEDRRPKSGGGYERMRGRDGSDPVEFSRPGSSGTRPSSSG